MRRFAILLVLVVTWGGCYRPRAFTFCDITCSSATSCPDGAACGRDGMCHATDGVECDLVDAAPHDTPLLPDLPISDATVCYSLLPELQICFAAAPTGAIAFDQAAFASLDTDFDLRCMTSGYALSGGTDACVVAGAAITVSVPVKVKGNRPLVVVGTASVHIFPSSGFDASSHGIALGMPTSGPGVGEIICGGTIGGESGLAGAGGAGGSYQTIGGKGGDGSSSGMLPGGGDPLPASTRPTTLLAGCQGGAGGSGAIPSGGSDTGGAGGFGGGAIAIVGTAITIEGFVAANGAGAAASPGGGGGGGGGGAGGLIVLAAIDPTGNGSITTGVGAAILAMGGGGGGGGYASDPGQPGNDGAVNTASPGGGGNEATPGGAGGDGATGTANGMKGGSGSTMVDTLVIYGSGGGAGGGVGWIVLNRTDSRLDVYSPPAQIAPTN